METTIFPALFFLVNQSMINPITNISKQRVRGKKNGPTIFLNRNIYNSRRGKIGAGMRVLLPGLFP
jgi:hypothetical protein